MPNTPLKQVRLTVCNDQDGEELMIEDRGGGVEIRGWATSPMEADRSATVDLPGGHCPGCPGEKDLVEQLGLTDDEWEDLKHWRKRKQRQVTAQRMGEVLDKLIAGVGKAVKDFEECEGGEHRIVLKVEADA